MRKPRTKKTLTTILTALLTTTTTQAQTNYCQQIVIKISKPPPAIRILNEQGDYALLDPKEKAQLQKEYIDTIQKITDIIGQYIQLRKQTEEIKEYLRWQWKRVEAGIEYKKDIWKQQIELNKITTQLKNIEKQLQIYGITKQEIEQCYKETK